MDSLTKFVEEKIAPPLIRFSQIRYVQVMQRMGLGIMSFINYRVIIFNFSIFSV